jgi:hypothetical protein
MPRTKSKASP